MAVALPIRLTDGSASISSAVSCNDTCRTSANDTVAVLVSFFVTDSTGVTLSESSLAVVTLSVTESARVVSSETVSVIDPNTATILASDTIAVVLASESYTLNSTSTVQDSLISGLVDSVNNLQVFTGSSTNNVSVSDSLQVRLNGIAQPPPTIPVSVADAIPVHTAESILYSSSLVASDSLAVRAVDTALTPSVTLNGVDSVQIIIAEPSDQQPSFGVVDSLTVQSGEALPSIDGSFAFNVTDSVAIQQSEVTSFGTALIGATDSLRIAESGILTNSARVLAGDSLRVVLTEVLSAFKDLSVADSLSVQVTDTAAPIFDSFIDVSASDSCAVRAAESVTQLVSFLQQLTASDSAVVGGSEAIATQFISALASEQYPVRADGSVSIWQTSSVTDSLRMGTSEAGLAIPIVPIGVSTFADDTILGAADGVASVSIVYEAFEYTVSDTCNVQGIDESRLQVGHYWEDELLVAAGDVASDTAVANATPETWNGHAGTEHRNDKPKPWKYIFSDKLNW